MIIKLSDADWRTPSRSAIHVDNVLATITTSGLPELYHSAGSS
jgi:hypothetical protein